MKFNLASWRVISENKNSQFAHLLQRFENLAYE